MTTGEIILIISGALVVIWLFVGITSALYMRKGQKIGKNGWKQFLTDVIRFPFFFIMSWLEEIFDKDENPDGSRE